MKTLAGRKVYICSTPQPSALNQAQYEALTWIEVGDVGNVGQMGTDTNIVNYPTLAGDVQGKHKGIKNAGDPVIECARSATDVGQVALRAAGLTDYIYAVKIENADKPSDSYTNTVHYNRGIVTGPVRPGGRNEDFILEVFTIGLVQREIVVNPTALAATENSTLPAISGIAQVGNTLTAYPGTWTLDPTFTYQWQADDAGDGNFADITGAASITYAPVVGNVGDALRVKVTGVNGEGSSVVAYSAPTQVLLAAE